MSRGRWLQLAAVAALVAGLALAVPWARRLHGDGPHRLAVTGTIEAMQVDVSARLPGRIVTLAAREGQPVRAGEELVRLDAEELTAEIQRAEAAVRAAEAHLRDLQAGARREEIEEAEARAARAQAQLDDVLAGARTQEIEQARAALRNAAATREWTEGELRRARELFGKDLIAMADVERARQAYEVAMASEASAREQLALREAGPRTHEVAGARAEARAARERAALLRRGPRPDAVSAASAQVAEARAALALARARAAELRLLSPLDGVVLRKNLEVGETANPGVAILTLMDPRDVWLRAYVAETDVGRLTIGQAAAITVDAHPDRRFAGRISEIASEAEFTPKNVQTKKERVNLVFRIKITVDNPDGTLKPGMPADAEITP
ncbi:MAG: efflux RND transporter periplasmic adaptor subunit [Candidatus Rokuibacteriota bacterium]